MRLLLVRHGDAYAGLHGVIAGPTGCAGLTDLGRLQSEALGRRMASSVRCRVDVLLTSELPRAIETAQIIAPALGFEVADRDCDLCEVHVGTADGLDWTEWSVLHGPLDMSVATAEVFAPGGESWDGFHERVRRTLERLASSHPHDTVVAVCHAGVITASLRVLLGLPHPGTGARVQPSNTGLTEWEHDPVLDRWTLHSFNDAMHLDELNRIG